MKDFFRIASFQTEGAAFPPETAQVEISSLDGGEQRAEDSVPETENAFVSQQLPVGKDPMDAKEEAPLGCALS